MKHAQPRDLRRRLVQRLLSRTKSYPVDGRIEIISRFFLGRPYKANPLIGSADTDELFTASLEGFDCVTYIESVLALARAVSVDDFADCLRQIRYEGGRVQWRYRNHYMTQWIANNENRQVVKSVVIAGTRMRSTERLLNVVPALVPRRTRVKCLPKSIVPRVETHLRTGDLIFFVSTRKNLDVFHAGILICDGNTLCLRHASRSRGMVVQQELADFLRTNRMSGVIVVRPQDLIKGKTVGMRATGYSWARI